jgi:phosphoserine phosphatase RsbU/P
VVADVAGKDVTAALYISMCKHALRALAEHIPSPAELMRKMNRFIHDHTEPEGFISMFYGLLEVDKGTLTYCTAGHEPGLLRRADGATVEHINTRGTILGVTLDATFEEATTSIEAGDVLLLYTDGLIQALSGGEANGFDVLKQALAEQEHDSGQGFADGIHEMTLSSQNTKVPDDIAIMVVRRDLEAAPCK